MLTLGQTVGKVCDLEGDSRLLRDLAVQAALSFSSGSSTERSVFGEADVHGLWDGLCVWGSALTDLIESLLTTSNLDLAFSSSLEVQRFRFAALQITVC